MVLADLDGDGDLDAYLPQYSIVSGTGDEVWLNNGDGTFVQSAETYGINDNTSQVAGGDLDNDGDIDIFVSNHQSASRVLLNDGDGTFTDSGEFYGDNGSGAGEVELADFNCDGILDAVIGRIGTDGTLVFSGDGDGTFTLLENLANAGPGGYLAPGTIGADVGDYDNDGDIDIAAGHIHGLGTVYLNDQAQVNPYTYQWDDPNNQTTATATNLLAGIYTVTVTDADGAMAFANVEINGPPDLSITVSSTPATCGNANDGTATATGADGAEFTLKPNGEEYLIDNEIASGVSFGDLDGDGDLDIFNTNYRTSALDMPDRVWFNDGDGTFTQSGETYSQGLITTRGKLGDFDQDGDLDVFQSGIACQVVLHNDGDGTFTTSETFLEGLPGIVGQDWNAIDIGDVNGDGFLDAVVGSGRYEGFLVYINDGDGTFTRVQRQVTAEGINSIALGDMDGDGDLDFFASGRYVANIVYFNDGTGNFTQGTQSYGSNSRYAGVGLADFDFDGDLDAFFSSITGSKNLVLHNNGDGTFIEMQSNFGEYGGAVNIGDIDNDGDLDVFTSGSNNGSSVFINRGDGTFDDFPQGFPRFGGYQTSDIGDLDGDGDLDVVVGHTWRLDVLLNEPNCFTYKWSGNAGGQTTQTAVDLGAGNYTVTATDASGCKISSTVQVGVAPDFTVSQVGPFCHDGLQYYEFVVSGNSTTYNLTNNGSGTLSNLTTNNNEPFLLYNLNENDTWNIAIENPTNTACNEMISGSVGTCSTEPDCDQVQTEIPTPELDTSQSDIIVQRDEIATLVLENYPTAATVIWYAEDQSTLLYSDVANLFQPIVPHPTTYYGAYIDPITGCTSNLLPVLVKAYYPLSTTIQYTASQCADVGSGTATVFAKGGEQSIGAGRFSSQHQWEGPQWGFRTKSADLDGDGDLDITAGEPLWPLTIWLNDGDATFTERFQLESNILSGNSNAHDLGDVDGDGDIDIFTTDNMGNLIVLFNDGNANFTAGTPFHFNRAKFAIELGDLDGDGDLDALETGTDASTAIHELRTWFNDGTGVFTQGTIYYPNYVLYSNNNSNKDIVLADLDGDGDLDAYLPQASLLSGTGDEVWLNNGDGTFTKSPETYGLNDNSHELAEGDFDGDGDIDIFVSNHQTPSRVMLNDGDGTFTDSGVYYGDSGDGAGEVEIADFNCDGILDVILGRAGSIGTIVYSGNGDGTFTFLENLNDTGEAGFTSLGTIGIDVGDYDNDGDIDIAAGRSNRIGAIFINDYRHTVHYTYQWDDPNNQTTPTATNLLPGFYVVTVTDADGATVITSAEINGPSPLAISVSATDASCGDANDGTATASPSGGGEFTLKPNGEEYLIDNEIASGVSFGDLDGDGDLDIFNTNYRTSGLDMPDRVWFNDGDGTFTQSNETYSQGLITTRGKLGDFDQDGDLDVFQSGFGAQVVLHNDGDGTFTTTETFVEGLFGIVDQNWGALDIGDINGDGFLDAIVGSGGFQGFLVYINDGDGTFTREQRQVASEGIQNIALGDVDGDGDLDFFAAGFYVSNIIYFNDGMGNFTQGTETYGGNNRYDGVGLADFDSDGDLDAFLTGIDGRKNIVLHNNGDGTFIEMQSNFGEYGISVSIGDMDGDGDLDVFTAGYDKGSSIFLNRGDGTFDDFPQGFPRFGSYQISDIGDLDGDGDLDVTVGHFGRIDVLLNEPNCFTYQWSGNAGGQTTQTVTNLTPGTYSVTATDASGCKISGSTTVNSAPALDCKINPSINTNNLCQVSIILEDILVDPNVCAGQIIFTIFDENNTIIISGVPPLSFNYSNYYNQTITVQAEETVNNTTCTSTLNIIDGQAPSIACPANLSIECDASTDPSNTGEPIVLDNCDPNPVVTYTDDTNLNGCGNYTGTILRTWTVTDGAGNRDSCTQIITIEDNTDPTFDAPTNLTIECDQDYTDLNITGNVSNIDDNCDANPILSFVDNINLDGCGGYTGTIIRIWSVTDQCGNDAGATQIITIADNSAPAFTVPADVTLLCSADPTDLNLTGSVTDLNDNCDTAPMVDFVDDAQILACESGTITRSWTSSDICGNQKTQTQIITVSSPAAPTIICPPNQGVACEDDIVLDPNAAQVTTDCNLSFVVYTSNPIISGAPNCNGTTYTYVYRVLDDCGQSAECLQTFTIVHPVPTLTCLPGEMVTCFDDIIVDPSDAMVSNSCDNSTEVIILPPEINGPKDCPGTTYTYTYRLNDGCGNLVECQRIFTNGDNEAPSIVAPIDITCECLAGINPNIEHAMVTTSCGNNVNYSVEVSAPLINGALDCPGTTYTYTYTVIDACGRTASDDQVFTVINSAPTIACPNPLYIENCETEGYLEIIEAWLLTVNASSACGIPLTVMNDYNPNNLGICRDNGFTEVNFYATDDCGRTSNCTGTIIITDTEPPVFLEEAEDMFVICNYSTPQFFNNWIANHGGAIAQDACWNDEITWSTIPANPSINCDGQNTSVTVTFVAMDGCENVAYTTATFTALAQNDDGRGNNAESQSGQIQVEQPLNTPEVILYQNEPNPFKEATTIKFYLPLKTKASLIIYDVTGREIKRFSGNYEKGMHQLPLDQFDIQARGVLFYQLETEYGSLIKKMLVID